MPALIFVYAIDMNESEATFRPTCFIHTNDLNPEAAAPRDLQGNLLIRGEFKVHPRVFGHIHKGVSYLRGGGSRVRGSDRDAIFRELPAPNGLIS